MKYSILVISLFLFSCTTKTEKTKEIIPDSVQQIDTVREDQNAKTTVYINTLYSGDSIIRNRSFVKKINETCMYAGENVFERTKEEIDQDNKRCVLSKLTFDYEKFFGLGDQKVFIGNSGEVKLFIKENPSTDPYRKHFETEVSLFIETRGKVTDQILIYKSKNLEYSALTGYYFINNNLELFLLKVVNDEEGTDFVFWRKYKIDIETGNIVLMEEEKNNQFQIFEW